MKFDALQMIWNGLVTLLTALPAAWLAVRISLRKFSTQKWWERREQSYAEIIGILSSLLVSLGRWENDELDIMKLSSKEKSNLFKKLRGGREQIEMVAREGAFRISRESSEALHEVVKALEQYGRHPMEGIDFQWKAVSNCLESINSEAKKDLGIDAKWYHIW